MSTHYELASPQDDPELRRLLRENAFRGSISLSFEREPDYFRASAVEGEFSQTLLVRDSQSRQIIGIGDRSIRPYHVNGGIQNVGYFSGLRVDSKYQQGMALARLLGKGFEGQHESHRDGQCGYYLMSVVADNHPAIRLLESNLPHYPRLHPFSRLFTFAIHPTRPKKETSARVLRGSAHLVPQMIDCINRYGERHQFSPYWTQDTLVSHLTPDLQLEDFFLVCEDQRVVGCLALWDQQAFKQTVVRGYGGAAARFRWLVNLLSPFGWWPLLPNPGTRINHCFACFLAVDGDDPQIFSALLGALYNEAARRSYDYFMLGLAEGHPFIPLVRALHPIVYESRIYLAAWEDGVDAVQNVQAGLCGLEIALL